MIAVVKRNPFNAAAEEDPGRLLVVFLDGELSAAAKTSLEKLRNGTEAVAFSRSEFYANFPGGAGRSKLANAFTAKKLGVECTARNWNTVNALVAIADEISRT